METSVPFPHLAITLLGIGEVLQRPSPACSAPAQIRHEPLNLEAKEGRLSTTEPVMTAIAALALYDGVNTLKMSDIAAALSSKHYMVFLLL